MRCSAVGHHEIEDERHEVALTIILGVHVTQLFASQPYICTCGCIQLLN